MAERALGRQVSDVLLLQADAAWHAITKSPAASLRAPACSHLIVGAIHTRVSA